ncbi:MAG TPA: MarR family transcriptional regulator [Bacteroidetes bacterium]|nr:transcriptional regulator SlyA [bacterium BMS3Bbin04]HDO66545.1 MarR family transcriptional regulator [Bacteroidota bacterium]HEX05670.1 MarR family transcriptional regulator [Bacteroidota bacterium]
MNKQNNNISASTATKAPGKAPGNSTGSHSLDESLGFLLNTVARMMRGALEDRLKQYNVTSMQWVVMQTISECEVMNQTAVAKRVEIDNPTMTRQVDRLEEAGLLKRRPDKEDRRTQLLSLTAKGCKLLSSINDVANEVNRLASTRISNARLNKLIEDLHIIHKNLSPNDKA